MKDPLTQMDAEVLVAFVDKMRERGATSVQVGPVRVEFGAPATAATAAPPPSRRKEKDYRERLFGHLPKGAPT